MLMSGQLVIYQTEIEKYVHRTNYNTRISTSDFYLSVELGFIVCFLHFMHICHARHYSTLRTVHYRKRRRWTNEEFKGCSVVYRVKTSLLYCRYCSVQDRINHLVGPTHSTAPGPHRNARRRKKREGCPLPNQIEVWGALYTLLSGVQKTDFEPRQKTDLVKF